MWEEESEKLPKKKKLPGISVAVHGGSRKKKRKILHHHNFEE